MTPEEKKWVEEVKGYCFRPSSPWINGRKDVDLPRAISIIEKQERMVDRTKDVLNIMTDYPEERVCHEEATKLLSELEEVER